MVGTVEQVPGRSHLHDSPVVQHRQPVRDGRDGRHVAPDEDEREVEVVGERPQVHPSRERPEIDGRAVEDEHRRAGRDRRRDRGRRRRAAVEFGGPGVEDAVGAVAERVDGPAGAVDGGVVGPPRRGGADRLAHRLGRAELLDAPRSYDSAATKARIAARAIYLNRVERRLRTLAEQRRDQSGAFEESIENSKASMTNLTEGLEARERPTPDRQPRISGVGGELRLTADAAPAYLTQAQLTHDQIPAIDGRSYPLAARNTNVFSVPYQTAADTVVDGLFGTNGDVSLQAAANELNATNRTLSGINDSVVFRDTSQMNVSTEEARALEKRASKVGELQGRRRALKEGVVESTNHLIEGQQNVLEARGIGSDDARSSMLVDAFAPWTTIHSQALALVNGTVTRRLTAIAARRANLSVVERDRLAIRLNETLERNMTEGPARPSLDTVNKSRSATHKVARQLARDAAGKIAERGTKRLYRDAMERSFSAMPAGVPLAPVPGYWYATMNVWHVEVRGQYARFGVRASQGRPTTPGGEFVYARDGDRVTLDVDGDGTGERLGRSTKVDFYASSTIMVVVPPGKTGVGDTNGVMIEQSKGWTRTDGE